MKKALRVCLSVRDAHALTSKQKANIFILFRYFIVHFLMCAMIYPTETVILFLFVAVVVFFQN